MKKLRSTFVLLAVILSIAGNAPGEETETGKKPDTLSGMIEGLMVDNIMTSELDVAEGLEVVVSRIVIPPNTELPKHWHPGEEFGYVLEGTVTFWQEGEAESVLKKGDVRKIPLHRVHNVHTTDSSATILVFRVHESGQPVRVLVE